MTTSVPDRLYASLPAEDPRFAELREYLTSVVQRGKSNLTERMLGEYALLGFLLTTGRLNGADLSAGPGADVGVGAPRMREAAPDPELILEEKRQISEGARSLGMFDD